MSSRAAPESTYPVDEPVACHSCRREVPRSVATMSEGLDYVFHFCGPDCFASWYASDPPDRSAIPE